MPIRCEDFISFAESIQSAPNEAAVRSSISRAYYGAYHHANAWHAALPIQGHNIGSQGGLHQILINQLTNPGGSQPVDVQRLSKGLGYMLLAMKNQRAKADYELATLVTTEEAANACAQARQLIARAK